MTFPEEYQEPTYGTAIQVVLMLRMLENARGGALSIREIAEKLEVHQRTVKRYVDAIGNVVRLQNDKPLIAREKRGRVPYAVLNREEHTLKASVFQYAAVIAASRQFEAIGDRFLKDQVRDALRVIRPSRQELDTFGEDISRVFAYVPFGPKTYESEERVDVLDDLFSAAIRRREVDLVYRLDSGREATRRFRPFCLILYRDGFYAYGESYQQGRWQPRYYAVDRITSSQVDRSSTFTVPADFDSSQLGKDTLGIWMSDEEPLDLHIAFSSYAARSVKERQWPGFVSWTQDDRGRHVLHIRIQMNPELLAWIAGWGPEVEVLGPESVRDQLRDFYAEALDQYI